MSFVARSVALASIAVLLLGASVFGATYEASVAASIQFPGGDAVAIGPDGTIISDFFDPILLSGNAGFSPFAGQTTFNFADQLLSLELGGPSGFANPHGTSVAQGEIGTAPVLLTNLTSAPLPLTLRVNYSYSLSATAGDKETASSSLALELFSRDTPLDPLESLFRFAPAISQNGSQAGTSFFDVFVTLPPSGDLELFLSAETAGEATVVPEPATWVTGCTLFGLLLARRARSSA
jgi:hypothetical protein